MAARRSCPDAPFRREHDGVRIGARHFPRERQADQLEPTHRPHARQRTEVAVTAPHVDGIVGESGPEQPLRVACAAHRCLPREPLQIGVVRAHNLELHALSERVATTHEVQFVPSATKLVVAELHPSTSLYASPSRHSTAASVAEPSTFPSPSRIPRNRGDVARTRGSTIRLKSSRVSTSRRTPPLLVVVGVDAGVHEEWLRAQNAFRFGAFDLIAGIADLEQQETTDDFIARFHVQRAGKRASPLQLTR